MYNPRLDLVYLGHQRNAKIQEKEAKKILRSCLVFGNNLREAGEKYAYAGYYAKMGRLYTEASQYFVRAYKCYNSLLFKRESDTYKCAKYLCKAGKCSDKREYFIRAVSLYKKIEEIEKINKYTKILDEKRLIL